MGKTNRNKEMAKPLSFKDFITVDYTQTGDRVQATNAKKRKQDTATGNTGEAVEMEALDFQQRRAKARSLKKNKAKIAMGRRRAEKRTASQDVRVRLIFYSKNYRRESREMNCLPLVAKRSKNVLRR